MSRSPTVVIFPSFGQREWSSIPSNHKAVRQENVKQHRLVPIASEETLFDIVETALVRIDIFAAIYSGISAQWLGVFRTKKRSVRERCHPLWSRTAPP